METLSDKTGPPTSTLFGSMAPVPSSSAGDSSSSEPQPTETSATSPSSLNSTPFSGATSADTSPYYPGTVQAHVYGILQEFGLEGEHFTETPRRVASLLGAFNLPVDLTAILRTGFEQNDGNMMVIQTNIPFKGLCAHHLVPFWGEAAIGYMPKKTVVGLSKLTRLVALAGTQRPSTQEKITTDIADALWKGGLDGAGVAVISKALHGCMAVRGPNAPGTSTMVSAMRGAFIYAESTRAEFLSLVNASWK